MFKAEIIADSKNKQGNRITTFVITLPRIILAEFNTHRALSRNSASSRAIPFEKMVKSVKDSPFIPLRWMKDHKGMQGKDYFEENEPYKFPNGEVSYVKYGELFLSEWLEARDRAVNSAEYLNELGLTKQVCNRLLEPFMWHTVIVTATEWENFFALRAHDAAEIHMQKIAYMMLQEYNNSQPKVLNEGEWHIPFGDKIEIEKINELIEEEVGENPNNLANLNLLQSKYKLKVATARCARVSYTVVGEENKPDNYKKDAQLHDNLLSMGHMSPFEHCAKPCESEVDWEIYGGNFKGFVQYRKLIEGENKTDKRVVKK